MLGFLPAIALLIYIDGKDYDSSLIQFQTSQPDRESMTDLFPREIAGFRNVGSIRTYSKDNLYEYVNGHAEYFISAGFIRLAVGEYKASNSVGQEPDVVVDIYDMGKSIHAFGILSDESGGNVDEILPGLTGFRTPLGMNFATGHYYVRISSYNKNTPLNPFAESVNSKIDSGADPFPEFSRLPEIGEVVTTRFIKEAYRGLEFINNVIEREYRVDGKSIQIFIVLGNKEEINKLVNSFRDYFQASDIPFTVTDKRASNIYRIEDPYEGEWVMLPKTDALLGVYGSFDNSIIETLL